MLKTGLEFATGTTEACQKAVVGLFTPTELFGWYRDARRLYKMSDLVLVTDARTPDGVKVWPRAKYLEQMRINMGANAAKMLPAFKIAHESAHQVVRLPVDSDAFWLVIEHSPIMCVLYANPYEELATHESPAESLS